MSPDISCAAAVPVIACIRRANSLPAEPAVGAAEVALAKSSSDPNTIAPLIERAVHVIYRPASERRSLSPGAWQLEIDALSASLEIARRTGFDGRWIYVSYSGRRPTRQCHLGRNALARIEGGSEQAIAATNLNYFMLRTGRSFGPVTSEPECHRVASTPARRRMLNSRVMRSRSCWWGGACRRDAPSKARCGRHPTA